MLTPSQRRIIGMKAQLRRYKQRVRRLKMFGVQEAKPQPKKKGWKPYMLREDQGLVAPPPPPNRLGRWRAAEEGGVRIQTQPPEAPQEYTGWGAGLVHRAQVILTAEEQAARRALYAPPQDVPVDPRLPPPNPPNWLFDDEPPMRWE